MNILRKRYVAFTTNDNKLIYFYDPNYLIIILTPFIDILHLAQITIQFPYPYDPGIHCLTPETQVENLNKIKMLSTNRNF